MDASAAEDLPPSLATLTQLIARRASALTGIDAGEVAHEIGRGRLLALPLADGRYWTFDDRIVSDALREAVEQAERELAIRHPRATA